MNWRNTDSFSGFMVDVVWTWAGYKWMPKQPLLGAALGLGAAVALVHVPLFDGESFSEGVGRGIARVLNA